MMTENTASQRSVSDILKGAVGLGYKVVDDHIGQGRVAAQRVREGSYNSGHVEEDITQLINRMVYLAKEMGVVAFDVMSAVMQDPRSASRSASATPGPSEGPASQFTIETRSTRPVQVKYQFSPTTPRFEPSVPVLHSADKGGPPLTGVKFVSGEDKRPVLKIEIPDQHPPGTYTGPIVDRNSKQEGGTLSISILR